MLRNFLQRRLRMEMLEDKRPLAANLFAEVVDGDLVITGDAGDNRFFIQSGSPDGEQYELGSLGNFGDTINGVPFGNDHFFSGVTGDIIINLGDGSDFVNVIGANGVTVLEMPGNLQINMGNGDDRIALGMGAAPLFDLPFSPTIAALDISGDLVIDMGAGTDKAWLTAITVGDDFRFMDTQGDAFLYYVGDFSFSNGIESDFGDDVSVFTGGGADEVALETINVGGDLLVSTAGGNDFLGMSLVDVAGSTLTSVGAGTDIVELQDSNLGTSLTVLGSGSNTVFIAAVTTSSSVLVSTSSGNDFIVLGGVQTGTALVTSGSGADEVAVVDSIFDNLLVSLGSGGDTLTIGGTTVNGLALLLGGGGADTLVDGGGNDILFELDLGFESLVS